jgi:4-hydroxythreonine-4-phosphate dehydrogenase
MISSQSGLRPLLAITMGDPNGIGPEIIAKCLAQPHPEADLVVIGDVDAMQRAAALVGLTRRVRSLRAVEEARRHRDDLCLLAASCLGTSTMGEISAATGRASFDYVDRAVDLALAGTIDGLVTAPIHKQAWRLAGVSYPGHTEFLAAKAGTDDFAMMLFNDELRVVLVSIHVPLREAIELVTIERELKTIRLASRAARDLGIKAPRVAVAGLNPHAGDGGLFGQEDDAIIRPAIDQARTEGIDATGPWSGDTVFMQARRGQFDIVVAQYHDQGLIPLKYLGLDKGVNATVGLPFIRTSVDHGTAFDIAGRGIADHASLATAIDEAIRFAVARGQP